MTLDEFIKKADEVETKTDFAVSWFAKKYMCFWDTVLERYTTCIDPIITYRKARN